MKPLSHNLELNMILVFIYMAGRQFGLLEKDILKTSQNNYNGFLTEYKRFSFLSKASYLLRPINVPFNNKWLRDTARDLHV